MSTLVCTLLVFAASGLKQDAEEEHDPKTLEILATLPPGLATEGMNAAPVVNVKTPAGMQGEIVAVHNILDQEIARYRTNRLFEQRYGFTYVPEFLDLDHDQIVELGNRFNLFADANLALRRELQEKERAAKERGDMETFQEFRKTVTDLQDESFDFARHFNHDIAEVLKPEQVSRLRAMAITTGLEHFGGWDALLEKSMTYQGVDPELITRLKQDREFQQKLLELRRRHYLRLIELNQQTMDEFLELLPKEPKAAVERTLNIDTLTRTRPTGQDK